MASVNRNIPELGDVNPSIGAGFRIKSRQTFNIEVTGTSNTATITSVNTSNSVVIFKDSTADNGNVKSDCGRLVLTNSTTVTANRGASPGGTMRITGMVIEFEPGVIVTKQAGTITIADLATSGTATITAIQASRAMLFYAGASGDSAGTAATNGIALVDITNSTTLTATRIGTNSALTVGYQVVEFNR